MVGKGPGVDRSGDALVMEISQALIHLVELFV